MCVMVNMLFLESILPGLQLSWYVPMRAVRAQGRDRAPHYYRLFWPGVVLRLDTAAIITTCSCPRQPQILLLWGERASRDRWLTGWMFYKTLSPDLSNDYRKKSSLPKTHGKLQKHLPFLKEAKISQIP